MPKAEIGPAWREDADPWLSKQEAIAYTGRSARTIERAVVAGRLIAGGTRGKRAFRRSALDAWLAATLLLLFALLQLQLMCECPLIELVTG